MKLALLFAGQGAQHAGMGADLYEQFPAFRQVLDECAAGVEFDLKSLCFAGPDETLNQTRYTQPCMVAFAAGVTRVLQEAGTQPVAAAGLSLGEYSALCAAGVFSPRQAVELAAQSPLAYWPAHAAVRHNAGGGSFGFPLPAFQSQAIMVSKISFRRSSAA